MWRPMQSYIAFRTILDGLKIGEWNSIGIDLKCFEKMDLTSQKYKSLCFSQVRVDGALR